MHGYRSQRLFQLAHVNNAIDKFCNSPATVGGDSGQASFNQSQVPGFEDEYPEIEIKLSEFDRKWDGTCTAAYELSKNIPLCKNSLNNIIREKCNLSISSPSLIFR
jgi:hypothetical protein